MRTMLALPLLALLGGWVGTAHAVDHANLDEHRPLRLEDAYPIAQGEISLETGAGFTLRRHAPNQGFFPAEVLYGALPNLQVGIGTVLFTDPHAIDDRSKSGDLRLSALYNFNQETIHLPAFAAKLGLDASTGLAARGYGVELRGIVTKSFDRLSVHLNAGYDFFTGPRHDERDGRYVLVLGASYPIGAPKFTRATLVGDVFAEQPPQVREPTTVGAEVGLRYQVTPRLVWDAGVGADFAGPARRSPFSVTTGVSFSF